MEDHSASLGSTTLSLRAYSKLRRLRYRDGRYIAISSMPKSGSTFLSRALSLATGYHHSYLAFAYGNLEQELYLPKLIDAYGSGTVTQQHFKANQANLALLRRFEIKPVVLVRNLFDILVSLRDHIVGENAMNLPGLEVDSSFAEQGLERQMDFVVDICVPWYLGYYVSWARAEGARDLDMLWLRYEEAIADWPGCVRKVLEFSGLSSLTYRADEAVRQTLGRNKSEIRLNKGVAGRGATTLTDRQCERIRVLSAHYPSTDFSRIGLHR